MLRALPYKSVTKPRFGSLLDPTHPLRRGLVAAWLMNEGCGTITNLVDGKVASPVAAAAWIAGKDGSALSFDNTDDQYNAGGNFYLEASTPFTIMWREKVTSDPGGTYYMGRLRLIVRNSARDAAQIVRSNSTGFYDNLFVGGADSGSQGVRWPGATAVASAVGVYKTFAITSKAGITNTLTDWVGYEDGVSLGNPSTGANWSSAGNTSSLIGNAPAGSPSNATIDTVYIWFNRVLNAAEIKTLYRDPYAIFLPTPSPLWWEAVVSGGGGGGFIGTPLNALRAGWGNV